MISKHRIVMSFHLIASFCFVSCAQTTLRQPLCTSSETRIPKEFEGVYRVTLETPSDTSIDLAGIQRPSTFVFQIGSSPAEIQAARLSNRETPIPSLFTGDLEFCKISDFGYLYQDFKKSTHTWGISKVVLQKNGFSIVPLSFHPDQLTKNKIPFLVIEDDNDSDGKDGNDSTSSLSFGKSMIIDNTHKISGDEISAKELLSLAQPLSTHISFVRIAETEQLRKLFRTRGQKLNLLSQRSRKR